MRANLSPFQQFKALQTQFGTPYRVPHPDIRFCLMAVAERVIGSGGINVDGLVYDASQLDSVRNIKSAATGTYKWIVRVDWNDVRYVYVDINQGTASPAKWIAARWLHAPSDRGVPVPMALRDFLKSHGARVDVNGAPIEWRTRRADGGGFAHASDTSVWVSEQLRSFEAFMSDLVRRRREPAFAKTAEAEIVEALVEAARASTRWYVMEAAMRSDRHDGYTDDAGAAAVVPIANPPIAPSTAATASASGWLPRKLL